MEDNEPTKYRGFEGRMAMLAAAVFLAMSVLGLRLWVLQVDEGAKYARLAEETKLQEKRLPSVRGAIFGKKDGEPVLLADNRSAQDLVMVRAGSPDPEGVLERLDRIVGVDDIVQVRAELENAQKLRQPHKQITVKRALTASELMRFEEFSAALGGVFTVTRSRREYPQGSVGGQILGYLGEIGKAELALKRGRYYQGDYTGKAGLEATYEDVLHGQAGRAFVNVYRDSNLVEARTDAYGQLVFTMDRYGKSLSEEQYRVDPKPGASVYTELDVDLQAYCEELLGGEIGAISVLNADTGAVLALASTPTFDPSIFVDAARSAERGPLLQKKPNPMLNRNYREVYPPGSTYKIVLAAAALEEGVVNANTTFYCPGHFSPPGVQRRWRCWRRSGHGSVNMVQALAWSCDVYFYNAGLKLGHEKIKAWSSRMGLGVPTGIDLALEEQGLIPDAAWREALMKEIHPDDPWEWKWYDGHTLNLSIGQGDAAVTPLQTAVMMATVTNGGRRIYPHLNAAAAQAPSKPFIGEATLRIIREGMQLCVEKTDFPSGTGRQARVPGVAIMGKTGTAQVVAVHQYEHYEDEEDIPYEMRDHAWFIAGLPEAHPPLAMAILVEHGLHGSSAAAPLAKAIVEFYYEEPDEDGMLLARETPGP